MAGGSASAEKRKCAMAIQNLKGPSGRFHDSWEPQTRAHLRPTALKKEIEEDFAVLFKMTLGLTSAIHGLEEATRISNDFK